MMIRQFFLLILISYTLNGFAAESGERDRKRRKLVG